MKRVALVGLSACVRCQRGIAFLKTEQGEHTIRVPIDACKAQEISGSDQEPEKGKSLVDLLLGLLVRSSHLPCQVVLDCDKKGFLTASVNITKAGTIEVFSCSLTEGVGLAVAGGIPLYAVEDVFEHGRLLHSPDLAEGADLLLPKLKPTLH
jgi:bifunctional DNase/RNase